MNCDVHCIVLYGSKILSLGNELLVQVDIQVYCQGHVFVSDMYRILPFEYSEANELKYTPVKRR